MTLQQLREKRAKVVADMEEVIQAAEAEGRVELDETEAELYAGYEQELSQVKAAIERRESLEAESAALKTAEPSKTHAQGAGDAHRIAPEAKQEFESLGEFMGAVVRHYRGRGDDPRLSWDDNAGIVAQDGQRMDTGESGGFLVPTKFRDTLLRVDPQQAVIEGRSNVMEAGDPPDAAITMPALDQTGDSPSNVYGGVELDWIGEGDIKPETEAKVREISWQPHGLAAHVAMTDKLMRNAPAFTSQIEMLMRGALTAAKETAFLRGNGVAKPIGMLEAGATFRVNRAGSGAIVYEDVDSMVARLLMDGSPYWLASQSIYTQLTRLESPEGHLIWQQNAVDGSPGSLFGYPVFWHQRSPLLGSYGDLVLATSNPYYVIKNGSGPFVSMGYINDDFVRNRTRIKVFANVDAKPWLTEPFRQESGYEVSPFVALDVPNG